jgi:hypothetical protein
MSMTASEFSEVGPPPRKSGMSGGAKLLISLGIVLGILIFLCAGYMGLLYYLSHPRWW